MTQKSSVWKLQIKKLKPNLMPVTEGKYKSPAILLNAQEIRRMEIAGVSMLGTHQQTSLVLIDAEEARSLQALPRTERAKLAAKTLRSADEVSNALFPGHWRDKLSRMKGYAINNFANDGAQGLPFAGCLFAIALQAGSINKSVSELMQGQLRGAEKITKLAADSIGAGGTLLEIAERLIFKFKTFRLKPLVRLMYGRAGVIGIEKNVQYIGRTFAAFGFVAVAWDLYHAIIELNKGNIGLSMAYFTSTFSGGILVASAIFEFVALGPVGLAIAVSFLLGAAVYIAMKSRDDIQKWLVATLWRQIPEGENETPAIWPTMEMEISELQQLIEGG
jgi:hypothetical protein